MSGVSTKLHKETEGLAGHTTQGLGEDTSEGGSCWCSWEAAVVPTPGQSPAQKSWLLQLMFLWAPTPDLDGMWAPAPDRLWTPTPYGL